MSAVIEFFSSLSALGWLVFIIVVLILINLRKILFLKSPLDSQDHKHWREKITDMSIAADADHLEQKHRRK